MSPTPTMLPPSPMPVNPTPSLDLGGLIGLVEGQERPLPLTEVVVRSHVTGPYCRTVIRQRFTNSYDVPMEAVHLFPLPPEGAITEVELRAGDHVVTAECREREEAQREFAAAQEAGHRAALVTQERADVHTLKVTNLPPGTDVEVRLVLVETLEAADGLLHWRFPTTIAPRFLVGNPTGHTGPGTLPDTDRVPDASRLSPPLRLQGGTRLDIEVLLEGPLSSLKTSLHAVQMTLKDQKTRIAPSGKATLNQDFILAFSCAATDHPSTRAYSDGTHTLLVVEPPAQMTTSPLPRDVVFVIDISGSMHGTKMEAAKLALQTALRGLMPSDRFKLIAFDDRVEIFANDFSPFTESSLQSAEKWIDSLHARGGTVMLEPLTLAMAGATESDRIRTILFITDGQAYDEGQLTAAVAHRRQGAQLYTLGIDTAVNASLLKRLARVGGGTCELLTPHDDIEEAVARIEARIGSPALTDISVDGQQSASNNTATAFSGRPAVLLYEGTAPSLHVTGKTPSGSWEATVSPEAVDMPLGVLWARRRIAHLEDRVLLKPFEEEAIRPEIIRIALAHHIASKYTAFIAVERSTTVTGERIEVIQPHELPRDWSSGGIPAPLACASTPLASAGPATLHAAMPKGTRSMRSSSGARRSKPKRSSAPSAIAKAITSLFDSSTLSPLNPTKPEEGPPEKSRQDLANLSSPPPQNPAAQLARTQSANGSFGDDPIRTALAVVALVLLGHTRHKGLRRRTVLKAVAWLQGHRSNEQVAAALSLLESAEQGNAVHAETQWRSWAPASPEGRTLATLL